MSYTHVDQVPFLRQWDSSSRYPLPDPGNAPANCGPTSVEWIARFYTDWANGINDTRCLASVPNYVGTSIAQQRTMLAQRGVSCYAIQPTLSAMREIVASGRRPMIVGLNMSRVPDNIAGHNFQGMHSVVLRKLRVVNGVDGFDVLDPNFSTRVIGRDDPTRGHRFYAASLVDYAFHEQTLGTRSWALVPAAAKVVAVPVPSTRRAIHSELVCLGEPVNIRSSPGGTVVGTAYKGQKFIGRWYETAGPSYPSPWDGKPRRDWVGVEYGGTIRWIAKAFLKTIRAL